MQSTTIVLPVHNMERTLRPEVLRVLDLAEILCRRISVAIVDDGSHDGTYEAACELSHQYPQVHALRQPYQRGLGAALEQVRLRLRVDHVVVHDGVAAINLDELADVLESREQSPSPSIRQSATDGRGSRRTGGSLVATSKLLKSGSFRWLRLDDPITPRRSRTYSSTPMKSGLPVAGNATAFANRAYLAT